MIDWQPIETADLEAEGAILGFGDGDGNEKGCLYIERCVYVMEWDGEEWSCFYSNVTLYPTHWAPWPNTPYDKTEE